MAKTLEQKLEVLLAKKPEDFGLLPRSETPADDDRVLRIRFAYELKVYCSMSYNDYKPWVSRVVKSYTASHETSLGEAMASAGQLRDDTGAIQELSVKEEETLYEKLRKEKLTPTLREFVEKFNKALWSGDRKKLFEQYAHLLALPRKNTAPEAVAQKSVEDLLDLFARMLSFYAKNKHYKHWNWATGIIRVAANAQSWPQVKQLVDEEIISKQEKDGKLYMYKDFLGYVPTFHAQLRRLMSSMENRDLAFMKLFADEMPDKNGKPDALMHAYFRGRNMQADRGKK